jgi:PAS domain S-box-containing protein
VFESFLAVPLHFTVEFLGFLVAAGAALLAASRPALVPGPRSNRLSVAMGFGAISIGQVLHGGSFDLGSGSGAADGADLVVGMRALGLALIFIGVVGTVRPAGAAAFLGLDVEKPLLLAPAGVAVLVALAAYSTSKRAEMRGYRRLAAAMLLLALSDVATSAVPDALFGTDSVEGMAYVAHGLKALGFLLVAAWFWSAIVTSIRIRFVASFGALLISVILTLSTALTGVISNNVEGEELERVQSQAVGAVDSIESLISGDLSDRARSITGFVDVAPRLRSGNDPSGLAEIISERNVFNADFVIADPQSGNAGFFGEGPEVARRGEDGGRTEFVQTKLTDQQRLALIGSPVYLAVVRGRTSSSAGTVRLTASNGRTFVAAIASQGLRLDSKPVGSITLGRWIDDREMQGLASQVSADVSLIDNDAVIASSFLGPIKRDISIPEEQRAEVFVAGSSSAQATFDGRSFFNGYAAIEENGRPVATLVISSRATVVASTRSQVNRLLFLAAMLVGAVALVLAWFSGRRITRPIQELTATATRVREGDLSAQAPVAGLDEVGELGATFNEMTASLLKMTTDLRVAAREEHSLRSRIETIIQSMADGLVAVDANGNILAFNREAEHLTGVPASEAVGSPITSILSARDGQGAPVPLPIHQLTEGSLGGVFLDSRDGDSVPVAITSAVLRSEDEEISGAVAVLRDMTREREVERMKTEFLSNISHELRTPLTPIKGYAEILQRKDVPPEKMKQFVRGILDSTGRLERIVELLVDFAAMEAGRMSPRSARIDAETMLEELAEKWRSRTTQHEFVTNVPSGMAPVMGDERLIRRSLDELLDNAVKFSPHGGRITLEAAVVDDGRDSAGTVELTIGDEGIGILPEDLPRVFSDFQQLDGSETRSYGGLGLGLAYARRIAQAHDGDIRVESEPDVGARFTIELPAGTPEPPAPEGNEGSEEAQPRAVTDGGEPGEQANHHPAEEPSTEVEPAPGTTR